MNKKVKIPFALLLRTIYVLEHFDMADYFGATVSDYDKVLYALNKKKTSYQLRDAYADLMNDGLRHPVYFEDGQELRAPISEAF